MAKFIKIYDFQKLLLPHGEDNITYSYEDDTFTIVVIYNDSDVLQLSFSGCHYQAFHPVPGCNILKETIDFWEGEAACVYKIEDSDLLADCAEYALKTGLPFEAQYYYCRFDSFNVGFHMISNSFTYELQK